MSLNHNSRTPVTLVDATGTIFGTAGNPIKTSVTGAGSGGTSSVDGDAFTVGVSSGTAIMGEVGGLVKIAALAADRSVNVTIVGGSSGNGAASNTGAAVPAQADYTGVNVGGNLRGVAGTDMDSGAGTEFALNISLRKTGNGGSVEYGTLSDPIRVDPSGTTTQPVSVASLPALPANQSTNVAQLAGTATDTNSGTKTAGTLRVVIATDQPALTNKLLVTPDLPSNAAQETGGNLATVAAAHIAQEATTAGVKGITAFGAVTTNAPTYVTAKSDALSLDTSGLLRVSLKDTPANTNKLLVTPDSVALPANQSVNVNQLAGTTTDTNSGLKSAGTLRVVIATDQPALTNKLLVTADPITFASAQAVTQSGNWTARIVGNAGGIMDAAGQNAASPASELLVAAQFNTTPTTVASGNVSPLQIDSSGNLLVNVKAGGGSGGTASNFGAAFPGTGTAAGFIDSGGNMAGANLDASGFLKVNVAAGSGGNGAASNTGAAVPAQADYQGVNVSGTLRGQTGVNPSGVVYAAQTDLTSVGGTTVVTGTGASGAGIARVTVANDSNILATQSGNWTARVVGNAGAVFDAAGQNVASPANEILVGAQFNTTPTTIANGNMSPLQLDNAGNLLVNIKAGSSGNSAASATGSAVPASADYQGLNVAGTLRGLTGVNPSGSIFAEQVDLASIAGTTADTNSGTKTAGTLRVVIATDQPALTNSQPISTPKSSTVSAGAQSSVGVASVQAIAANANRKKLFIQNTGLTVLKFLYGAGTATQTAYHFALAALGGIDDGSSPLFIDDMWTGAVQVISAAAGGTYVISELT